MAFKGTHEIDKKGVKHLVKDFCTSEYNLNSSKWLKPTSEQSPLHKLLERMSDEYNLVVEGMNVVI